MDIEKAIKSGKTAGAVTCPECGEKLFSPLDKTAISLYGKCPDHLTERQIDNLFAIIDAS